MPEGVPDFATPPAGRAEKLARGLAGRIEVLRLGGVLGTSCSVSAAVDHETERRAVVDAWTDLTAAETQALRIKLNDIRRAYEREQSLPDRATVVVVHWASD